MVKLIPVNPADLPTERLGRRGRVSYPLLKSFMETNQKMVKLDLTGLGKNPSYLRSVLYTYIRSHKMPIKLFSAGGDLHLMRLDLDNEGNPIPGWKFEEAATEGNPALHRNDEATPITAAEVTSRYGVEVGQATK